MVSVPQSHAAESTCNRLPEVVLAYLKTLDPKVVVREDCLSVMSDDRSYLPVLPQKHENETPPNQFVKQFPTNSKAPDWVQFNNGYYLLRLIETANGKITLPRTDTIPTEVKTGLIPQNFMVPNGFSIPSDLRVIVGDLPYETPDATSPTLTVTDGTKAKDGLKGLDQVTATLTAANTIEDPILFTASQRDSRFVAWDAIGWKQKWTLDLNCLSTSAAPTNSGAFIYVNCLNSPKIDIIDLQSQAMLNQLELQEVAHELVQHPYFPMVVALHRYAKKLTFIDSEYHLIKGELNLPFPVQTITMHQRLPLAYAVETNSKRVLEIDMQQQKVLRTIELGDIAGKGKISTLWIDDTKGRFGILWMLGKERDSLDGLDLFTGELIYQLETPTPLEKTLFIENKEGERWKNPLLLTTQKGLPSFTMIDGSTDTPQLVAMKPITGLEGEETPVWMGLSPSAQSNEGLGLDAVSEKTFTLVWNPEQKTLTAKTPVLGGLRSNIMVLIEEPTPDRLAAIQKKREALAAIEGETEILQSLRTRPEHPRLLGRLGGLLKFAPRDQ